jgi:hypothetical protein
MTALPLSRSAAHDVHGRGRAQPTAGTCGKAPRPQIMEAGRFAAGTQCREHATTGSLNPAAPHQ